MGKILNRHYPRKLQGRNKKVDIENGLEDMGWEGEAGAK